MSKKFSDKLFEEHGEEIVLVGLTSKLLEYIVLINLLKKFLLKNLIKVMYVYDPVQQYEKNYLYIFVEELFAEHVLKEEL